MKVRLKTFETLRRELDQAHQRIAARAHEIFEARGRQLGQALDDWVSAEHDLAWRPPMDLEECGDELVATLAVPGVDAARLDVRVAPDTIVVAAPAPVRSEVTAVHARELPTRAIARTIPLPARVVPGSAHADLRDGVLRITITKAVEAPLAVPVETTAGALPPTAVDGEC